MSIEMLERFNQASRDSIDVNPKVRIRSINQLLELYYAAPQLKVSIESKLGQLAGDSDDNVAKYAKRILQRVSSGQRQSYYTVPTRTGTTSTGATRGTATKPRETKNIVANIVCCVVMIVVYFIMYIFVFP
ncbi:MAG: hypothetical protein HWN65_08605 [Candidatus Helarchaeota archaeon]|nr:hypothetical protein [Candidatus Helarchaeota archaeon]